MGPPEGTEIESRVALRKQARPGFCFESREEAVHGFVFREAMPSVREPVDQAPGEETMDEMDPHEQVLPMRAVQGTIP